MHDEQERLQIGEFAELVGLSIPQLRRYDRLQLLRPRVAPTPGTATTAMDRPAPAESLPSCSPWTCPSPMSGALASGPIELLFLVAWDGTDSPPAQSAYAYVEDPDSLCSEYEQAGATIVEPVDSRSYGMRDFVVRDLDGHRFTLGRGEENLREVADFYGLSADQVTVNQEWLKNRP